MQIIPHQSLKDYNTFHVNQFAEKFGVVTDLNDVLEAIDTEPGLFILGGGSNVLLTRDLPGLVIKNEIKGREILLQKMNEVLVRFYSGENWHESVKWCVDQGFGGIENLSLIPGTVGAAPIQNIGAYGVELKEVCMEVNALDLRTGNMHRFYNKDCAFGYRDSIFKHEPNKGNYFIHSVVLKLNPTPTINSSYADVQKKLDENKIDHPDILAIHNAVMDIRTHKLPDPNVIGNAGSFFKNPVIGQEQYEQLKSSHPNAPSYRVDDLHVKVPAGWLIDQAGWKGKSIGQVGCYEKQALVIVNLGNATGQEILDFSKSVQSSVQDKFGIQIEPEINIW